MPKLKQRLNLYNSFPRNKTGQPFAVTMVFLPHPQLPGDHPQITGANGASEVALRARAGGVGAQRAAAWERWRDFWCFFLGGDPSEFGIDKCEKR